MLTWPFSFTSEFCIHFHPNWSKATNPRRSEGEYGVARAAAKLGVLYIMSTASSSSPEEIAQASGDARGWFRPYWLQAKDNDITVSMLSRAKAAGFSVLVVTLDLWALSWRPMDLNNVYVPFYLGVSNAISFTNPVFRSKYQAVYEKIIKDNITSVSPK